MSTQLSVFVITPYAVDTAAPFFVAATEIEEAIAIAVADGLESFVVEDTADCGVSYQPTRATASSAY